MVWDLSTELIHATVQLEQPLGDGTRTVGTGFLIQAPGPDGAPRTVLVTANHVLAKMPSGEAKIGFSIQNSDGSWSYSPQPLQIRDKAGAAMWTKHPARDVAVLSVKAPSQFAKAAIPLRYLASDETFAQNAVGAGDEMMALGFPRGLAANQAGFPILRSGRVASYPVAPAKIFPTFLLDFSVFPGNSGGPVFVSSSTSPRAALAAPVATDASTGPATPQGEPHEFVAGLLTQQVELNNERLEIGIVTHAKFIREAIALIDNPLAPVTVAKGEVSMTGAKAASAEEAVARD
jgi:V8-like Glu-specific endopeptidase